MPHVSLHVDLTLYTFNPAPLLLPAIAALEQQRPCVRICLHYPASIAPSPLTLSSFGRPYPWCGIQRPILPSNSGRCRQRCSRAMQHIAADNTCTGGCKYSWSCWDICSAVEEPPLLCAVVASICPHDLHSSSPCSGRGWENQSIRLVTQYFGGWVAADWRNAGVCFAELNISSPAGLPTHMSFKHDKCSVAVLWAWWTSSCFK